MAQPIIEKFKKNVPQYHTRAMRKAAYEKFGLVMASTKPSILRHLYKDFVCDSSSSANLSEAEVDKRVATFFELEEPSLIYDLRDQYVGHERQSKFDVFWNKAKEVLEEDIHTAVNDRRHSAIVHVAKAVSVRDLHEQVAKKCPEGALIPSDEWIRLQFSPTCLSSHAALRIRYTGKLDVHHKVQQRQFHKEHQDSHYAACIFRYESCVNERACNFCLYR